MSYVVRLSNDPPVYMTGSTLDKGATKSASDAHRYATKSSARRALRRMQRDGAWPDGEITSDRSVQAPEPVSRVTIRANGEHRTKIQNGRIRISGDIEVDFAASIGVDNPDDGVYVVWLDD